MSEAPAASRYPFRPWVRSTCRRAMIWGVGVVALLAALAVPGWLWLTLLKVWWTAGLPAVEVDERGLAYQPLHTFRPRRTPWERVLASGPRPGTQSLRLVVRKPRGGARELFLNLGVIRGRHRLLDQLDELLADNGLLAIPGRKHAWRRPEWVETEMVPPAAGG